MRHAILALVAATLVGVIVSFVLRTPAPHAGGIAAPSAVAEPESPRRTTLELAAPLPDPGSVEELAVTTGRTDAAPVPPAPAISERERMQELMRKRFAGRRIGQLTEADRWFERYCLLELGAMDFREAGPFKKPVLASGLSSLVVATWMDSSGRWHPVQETAGTQDGSTMVVNNRRYQVPTGEFPNFDELQSLLQPRKDLGPELKDAALERLYRELDVEYVAAKAFARGHFDPRWLE